MFLRAQGYSHTLKTILMAIWPEDLAEGEDGAMADEEYGNLSVCKTKLRHLKINSRWNKLVASKSY